jgi:uncharacterized protein
LKKILLISDTHGHLDPALIKHIHYADEVWHAGDIGEIGLCDEIAKLKPFRAVYGNIDDQTIRKTYPEILNFTCEQVAVLMIHIGATPGRFSALIKDLLKVHKPKLFICGHSHILKVMYDKGYDLLYMNSGAAGVHGFHTVKTALRFEIDGTEIKNLAVIELGSRTSVT